MLYGRAAIPLQSQDRYYDSHLKPSLSTFVAEFLRPCHSLRCQSWIRSESIFRSHAV